METQIKKFLKDVSLWEESGIPLTFNPEKLRRWFFEERGGVHNKADVFFLMFGITYKCQLNCPHCCMGTYKIEPQNELTTAEIKEILDQSDKAFLVNFFGGEPTLRNDLLELIKYASERSLYVFLDTNGIKITRDYARQLKENGLELLNVSIDSPVPEKHDQLRGRKGVFDTAVQGIRNALEVQLKCTLSTYVTKETLANGEFEATVKLAGDLGAQGLRYVLPTASGRWLHHPEVKLSPEEEKKIRDLSDFPFLFRDFYFQTQGSSQCRGLSDHVHFYISPYGDVTPCCLVPISFGNTREEPLKDILRRMWSHEMFSEDWVETECPMLNEPFRNNYINLIQTEAILPYDPKRGKGPRYLYS